MVSAKEFIFELFEILISPTFVIGVGIGFALMRYGLAYFGYDIIPALQVVYAIALILSVAYVYWKRTRE